jgi:hypothetical protein
VYTKRPFAGPESVLQYLGRYTHRIAISNDRIVGLQDGVVRFRWRDYSDDNQNKFMELPANEFLRRFLLHVLPRGFASRSLSAAGNSLPLRHRPRREPRASPRWWYASPERTSRAVLSVRQVRCASHANSLRL